MEPLLRLFPSPPALDSCYLKEQPCVSSCLSLRVIMFSSPFIFPCVWRLHIDSESQAGSDVNMPLLHSDPASTFVFSPLISPQEILFLIYNQHTLQRNTPWSTTGGAVGAVRFECWVTHSPLVFRVAILVRPPNRPLENTACILSSLLCCPGSY